LLRGSEHGGLTYCGRALGLLLDDIVNRAADAGSNTADISA
jgi:hypothetical protein